MNEIEKLRKDVEKLAKRTGTAVDVARGKSVFKAKVIEGGRLTIPEPERETLGIREGDIVQVSLEKIEKSNNETE